MKRDAPHLASASGIGKGQLNAHATACGQSPAHESARAQVNGNARYVDDIPQVQGMLHAAPIMSRVAHGRFHGLDADRKSVV